MLYRTNAIQASLPNLPTAHGASHIDTPSRECTDGSQSHGASTFTRVACGTRDRSSHLHDSAITEHALLQGTTSLPLFSTLTRSASDFSLGHGLKPLELKMKQSKICGVEHSLMWVA